MLLWCRCACCSGVSVHLCMLLWCKCACCSGVPGVMLLWCTWCHVALVYLVSCCSGVPGVMLLWCTWCHVASGVPGVMLPLVYLVSCCLWCTWCHVALVYLVSSCLWCTWCHVALVYLVSCCLWCTWCHVASGVPGVMLPLAVHMHLPYGWGHGDFILPSLHTHGLVWVGMETSSSHPSTHTALQNDLPLLFGSVHCLWRNGSLCCSCVLLVGMFCQPWFTPTNAAMLPSNQSNIPKPL